MLPPEEYRRCANRADFHIQLKIEQVEIKSDQAHLSGPVVRVFRGPAGLQGTSMRLAIQYFSPGEEDSFEPGSAGRIPLHALRVGRALEAFVVQTPSGLEIPLDLYSITDSATETPQIQFSRSI